MEIRQGIDITSVKRMQAAIERHDGRFEQRVFTADEIAYCQSKRMKYEHFAARFAAKEAFMKAAEVRRQYRYCFREIEVKRRATGKPFIHLSEKTRRNFRLPEDCQIELSMAHERDFAVATVVIQIP